MKKTIALFLVTVFALILAGCVQPEEQYCTDPTSGARLGLAEAAQIAYANSECNAVGQFDNTSNCNQNSGTWWFGLETNQTGCAAACVVYAKNKTAYVQWMCTGLLPPEECADTTTGTKMLYSEAQSIASNSGCVQNGSLKAEHWCNNITGTWWISLDINKTGCSPACVINVVNKTAEINWMCTGLLPGNENKPPGSDKDAHGCIPSAGYTWCNATQKCYRSWEENCTIGLGEAGPKAQFRKGPYLLFPGNDNSMTVLWQTDKTPANAKIAWGKTTQYEGGQAVVQESGDHQFSYTISGLEAGTVYYYAVSVDSTSQKGSFNTAPPNDSVSLTFYAYGDTRSNPTENDTSAMERDKIATQILRVVAANPAEHQTILLHTGDYVARGLTENFWDDEYFNRSSQNSMEMMAQLPILGAIGNHETYAVGGSGETQEQAGALFKKYWPNPLFVDNGCFYYSFDYGPAHFIALDQYKCDYAKGSAQYAWAEKDLAATQKRWKIVFFHAPAWSASEPDPTEQVESSTQEITMAKEYTPLFSQEGVKLVLQGHRHYYARSLVNGTQYLTLGGGGAELSTPQNVPYLVKAEEAYHFAKIDINGSTADVQIIDDNGKVIDSFTVNN
ncbi:MAG: metallophosphoesterase family protein [Candidatus Micrarchaeota archaeon]